MSQEQRRAKRVYVCMTVAISLRDTKNRVVLAGPVPGDMLDISLYGARLAIPHIRVGIHHLFYACSDDPDKVIDIEASGGKEGERLVLSAHPVWFDHVLSAPAKHFEIGMQFLAPPDDPDIERLYAVLAEQAQPENGWLKKFFGCSS